MSTLQLTVDESTRKMIDNAYRAFNARDIEDALATMQSNVEWPNGMEGGTISGRDGVRDYWIRQWKLLNPRVDPVKIDADGRGRIVVAVHQVVRNLSDEILLDRMVEHVYCFEDGLIRSMEIRE